MSKRILKEEAITLEKVKEKLLERDEENAPLNYIQRVTLDYAFRFSKDIQKSELLVDTIIKIMIGSDEIRRILSRDFTDTEEEDIRRARSLTKEADINEKREEIMAKHARRKAIQLITIDPEGHEDIMLVLNENVPKETLEELLIVIKVYKEQYKDLVTEEEEKKITQSDQAEDLTFEGFVDDDLE